MRPFFHLSGWLAFSLTADAEARRSVVTPDGLPTPKLRLTSKFKKRTTDKALFLIVWIKLESSLGALY